MARSTLVKQPPAAEAENPGSNGLRLRRVRTGEVLCLFTRQQVVGPAGRNARPLDHPLGHRQQQGDEAQKHQLCMTPSSVSIYLEVQLTFVQEASITCSHLQTDQK